MSEYDTYLAHHGIKGQIHGIRRFQNYDGSLTPEGRIRYGVGNARKNQSARQANKEKRRAEKKAQKEAEKMKSAEEEKEELKQYLRKHPKKFPKYSQKLTQADVDEIVKNINFDRKLKDIRQEEIDRGYQKIKSTTTRVATIAGLVNQGLNIYNSVANTYNLLYDLQERSGASMAGKKKLPQATVKSGK